MDRLNVVIDPRSAAQDLAPVADRLRELGVLVDERIGKALTIAFQAGAKAAFVEVCAALIEHGIDVQVSDDGEEALEL